MTLTNCLRLLKYYKKLRKEGTHETEHKTHDGEPVQISKLGKARLDALIKTYRERIERKTEKYKAMGLPLPDELVEDETPTVEEIPQTAEVEVEVEEDGKKPEG